MNKHILVIGGASRGARYFIKNALNAGNNVTAVCRGNEYQSAAVRLESILALTTLTPKKELSGANVISGKLQVLSYNIQTAETYIKILTDYPDIDSIFSFIGPTRDTLFNRKIKLYTTTISAIVEGMRKSRYVEFYYHGSVGSEGVPGESSTKLPAHYPWYKNILLPILYPVFKDVTESENLLAKSKKDGLKFVIFRPDALTNEKAKRNFMYTFDHAIFNKPDFNLKTADKFISREDVAEEILRISTLPLNEREIYFGHAVYMVDKI
ncbi:MAG: NAD(P)H-binding protein [Bacteriovorax sp.]|nr:NAD(P)H-binding protein [Bacteriovorax sp.]